MTTTSATGVQQWPTPAAMSWQRFAELSCALANNIADDGVPDVVVGVVRGGMMPAVLIAHHLGVRTVRAFAATHTIDDSVNAAKFAAPAIRDTDSLGDLSGLDVLVVDDVAGTGMTAQVTAQHVEQAGARRVRTAVLVVNEANWTAPTPPGRALTYIAHITHGWVIFPWEEQS
jgi:uncharacterized protein